MKTLVVEDDFLSRRLLQTILHPYGVCDVAVDGEEALTAFALAWEELKPYDLVCLDIMMPGTDGQETLREIRNREDRMGINADEGVKVIMTTALDDRKNVMAAFRSQCDAYIVKPIERDKVIAETKLGITVAVTQGKAMLNGRKPHRAHS
jgi:two-component system, chemotaxis family, chemotaxis protein CheY